MVLDYTVEYMVSGYIVEYMVSGYTVEYMVSGYTVEYMVSGYTVEYMVSDSMFNVQCQIMTIQPKGCSSMAIHTYMYTCRTQTKAKKKIIIK